jgi:hypothetical protein
MIAMTVSFYADYIAELRTLFAELNDDSDLFQTFHVHIELVAAGSLVVYETKRRKGQTDNLFYGRPAQTTSNRQISRETAAAAINHFFSLGQFIALTGTTGQPLEMQYPHCAINFSYRKKGHPAERAMLMVFVGFNDDTDASDYAGSANDAAAFVCARPYHTPKAYEWK